MEERKLVTPTVQAKGATDLPCDVLIVPLWKGAGLTGLAKDLDRRLGGFLARAIERDRFEAEEEKTLWIEGGAGLAAKRVLLVGLGDRKGPKRNGVRCAYGTAAREVTGRVESVGLPYTKELAADFDAAIEGFLLGTYRFDKYRTKAPEGRQLKTIGIGAEKGEVSKLEKIVVRVLAVVKATFLARDWVNEPANVVTPTYLTQAAERIAKEQGLTFKVLNEAELKKREMNLILAVGMGSSERPRMVHLEYKPKKKATRSVALVGKGVTFDSGGLSLKPQNNMYGMKMDMSGAAGVLATMWAVSELELPVHVHGICPLVENVPSSHSVKPGDVFKSLAGKHVEIENTDAEGRLILADALAYAEKLKVTEILDVATLTGACMVALGDDIAGVFTPNDRLADRVIKAGDRAGERFWRLPLEKSYHRLLKSDVADLKNVGGKYGGAITAALFLSEFVGETPWAHLDIAGPAMAEHEGALSPKGGTGYAVRTFLEFLSS